MFYKYKITQILCNVQPFSAKACILKMYRWCYYADVLTGRQYCGSKMLFCLFSSTGNTTDVKLCPSPSPPPRYVNHTSRPPLLEIIIGLVLLAITLAVGGVIVCILALKYLQRKNHGSLQLLEPLYGKSESL